MSSTRSDNSQQNATIANRFLLTRKVGTGATADVYLAHDLILNREVALKVIHRRVTDDPVLAARVRAEVELARDLVHEAIVRVLEYVETDTNTLIVMEYLSGGDLRSRILSGGRLPPADVERIAESILNALAYAHERGIVHRDIKPRNVLFSQNGDALISDFGLARSMSSAGLSETDSVAGTPEYTAPETITASLWDPRSDLYGVGCTLFEALTGEPPYSANTPAETLRLHVEAPLPSLPEEIEREHTSLAILVTTLLARDPNERPQSAREAAQLLEGSRSVVVAPSESRPCPSCGSPMSKRYDWCFTCQKPSLPARGVGRGGTTVFVTGPGKAAEKLAPELRDACSDVASAMGLWSTQMQHKVPRLPFVLARGLDRGSAIRLRQELTSAGLEVMLCGPGDMPRKAAAGAIFRKVRGMAPRVYLVVLGTSGGMWQAYTRMPGAVAAAIIGTMLIGIPIVMSLIYRSSVSKLVSEERATGREELNQLLVTVSDPLIHARVKNIVEAGASLLETVQSDEEVDNATRSALAEYVGQSIERSAALGMALHRAREGTAYARHTAALSRSRDKDGADQSVAIVRKMDSVYTQALEMIGSVALDIHATAVRLARTNEQFGPHDLTRIRERVDRLVDKHEAWKELEQEITGGTE